MQMIMFASLEAVPHIMRDMATNTVGQPMTTRSIFTFAESMEFLSLGEVVYNEAQEAEALEFMRDLPGRANLIKGNQPAHPQPGDSVLIVARRKGSATSDPPKRKYQFWRFISAPRTND